MISISALILASVRALSERLQERNNNCIIQSWNIVVLRKMKYMYYIYLLIVMACSSSCVMSIVVIT